ncbi:MAG: hydroxymethylbilane synthase [Bacteroidia bacterium]|nr:hydroxymethylbilane synthase [Bacteroidia bacterium]
MPAPLIIGSRGSDLALWQANHVREQLAALGVNAEVQVIKTRGDNIQDIGFDKMEGKGFFTKELEDALLKKEIDLAVHSHKDLPTVSPAGLVTAAVSGREDPSELLLIHPGAVDGSMPFSLKKGAKVGTSSARRKSQWLALRPDCSVEDLRGNVPTRIRKVSEGMYDAILIAAAGINRLESDTGDLHIIKLAPKEFVPAPSQGVLALQCREADEGTRAILARLNHPETERCISVERKLLNLFDGGCHLPLGVFCEKEEDDDGKDVFSVWAAHAQAWDKKPAYLYYRSNTPSGLAERMLDNFRNLKPASVFISRNRKKQDLFCEVLEGHGYRVTAQPLIEFRSLPFFALPDVDWIFFSSKHAVKFFFTRKPELPAAVKFGVIGKSTADEVRRYGYSANFIGQGTDTRLIGKQFAALAGNRRVLFPQAKGSMRTVQLQLTRKENAVDVIVYETVAMDKGMNPEAEVMVFTSPSNVESFLSSRHFPSESKIIAMGDATAHAIKKSGGRVHGTPAVFTDLGLLQAVFKIS